MHEKTYRRLCEEEEELRGRSLMVYAFDHGPVSWL